MPLLMACPDYANTEARAAVDPVLWNLLHFLDYRMDTTRGSDASGAYLFNETERGGTPPVTALEPNAQLGSTTTGAAAGKKKKAVDNRDHFEKALQLDCMHFLRPSLGRAAHLEASDVAAGRADILVELHRTRLVIEVKREDSDASHDALCKRYGAQATEYSNTSARVGFLLVLDRSRTDGSAGHIEEKVSVQTVYKLGDVNARMLVIVVMPGKRKRPSALK